MFNYESSREFETFRSCLLIELIDVAISKTSRNGDLTNLSSMLLQFVDRDEQANIDASPAVRRECFGERLNCKLGNVPHVLQMTVRKALIGNWFPCRTLIWIKEDATTLARMLLRRKKIVAAWLIWVSLVYTWFSGEIASFSTTYQTCFIDRNFRDNRTTFTI